MKPRRLLIVSEPGAYGIFIFLRDLIGHLAMRHPEIEVDLAYSSRRWAPEMGDLVADVERRGGQTFDMKVGSAPERADLAAWRGIGRLVAERRPGLVHAHSSKAGGLVRLRALLPGFPPVLYTPHAYYGLSRKGGRREMVFNAVERLLGPIGRTHHVSSYERDFGCQKLHVARRSAILIYNGIDLRHFVPATPEERLACRRELGLPEEGKLMVTLGRESPQKNFAPLYAALDRTLPGSHWHFAHAGSGSVELRARLGAAAAERVFAFTFLDRPEKLLRAADGFIMPSLMEGFSIAAVEALACGLPLIVTASTGFLSLRALGFGDIRWLPDPATVPTIESEIAAALGDWAAAPAFDCAAQRRRVEKWFDGATQLEKLVRVYRRFSADAE